MPASDAPPVLECRDLVRRFGERTAVDHVSFSVAAGETYGLLGPNGAGKSTTIRLVCGLLARHGGAVRLAGQPIDARHPSAKAVVGYVPQDIALYPDLSAAENLRFFGRLYGLTGATLRGRVEEVLDLVDLADRAGDAVDTFSGGMKRRLNIAAGLLHRPELLVLDEPTAGLDPEQRIRFRDLVAEAGRGRTVVLSTHQTEDVAAVCSHVVVVDGGRTLFAGSVPELVRTAEGRVWLDDDRDPRAVASWRLASGEHHQVGDPPAGAHLADPTIEDAYLLLLGPRRAQGVAA